MNAQFQIGDRVSCNEYQDADWQIVNIKGGHALIELQEVRNAHLPEQRKITQRRRVPFWQLQKLPGEEPQWSHWYWLSNGIFRHQGIDLEIKEECSDRAYLEAELKKLEEIKEEYAQKAASAKGKRKKDFERGVRDKDKQIEYVRQRLKILGSPAESVTSQPEGEVAMSRRVDVEIVEELTDDEQRDRLHLERKVERAFYEAGKALRELRDRRLYRSTHRTFEEYCRERFTFSRQAANYLIAAADVFDNLTTNGCQVLPTKERQTRAIATLKDPELQCEAWQLSVDEAGGKVPSNRIVKDIVQRIKERTPIPNPYQLGEVCSFVPKDNPELKGKSRCWAIVKEVHEWSCTVQAWSGEYQVKIENLKSQELSPVQREEVQLLSDRLARLQQIANLDRGAYYVLKGLGEQTYLTEVEERLLGTLEEYYFESH